LKVRLHEINNGFTDPLAVIVSTPVKACLSSNAHLGFMENRARIAGGRGGRSQSLNLSEAA
jgi:hypothetical protein